MENTEPQSQSFLDRTLAGLLRLDIEKILWFLLLVIAVLSRTIGLGDRAMSHDEEPAHGLLLANSPMGEDFSTNR